MQIPMHFVGQIDNLRRIANPPFVGQPILAAAAFQAAPAHRVDALSPARERVGPPLARLCGIGSSRRGCGASQGRLWPIANRPQVDNQPHRALCTKP
jgi:hypothetical protein